MQIKNVIIYTGDILRRVNLDYFFQDEFIDSITKDDIIDVYANQKVFVTLTKNAVRGEVDGISNEHIQDLLAKDRLAFPKMEKGLELLEGMIMDMHGDKAGKIILKNVNTLILEECG